MRSSKRELRERSRKLTEKVLETLPEEVLEGCPYDWLTDAEDRESITAYLERAIFTCSLEYKEILEGTRRVLEARFWLLDQSVQFEGSARTQLRTLARSLMPSVSLSNDDALRCYLARNLPSDDAARLCVASAADC
jgi:hypothetical protein